MDNRLDFANSTNNHLETLTEDDTLLVITHNKKEGDLFFSLFGDWENISMIMSNKEAVNHSSESEKQFNDIKKLILNTALNICEQDSHKLGVMLEGLQELRDSQKALTVIADKKGYVDCPFCGEKHKHGKGGGNGNRVPDCTAALINSPLKGGHHKKDGYYVVFT
tara:strand:- start:448 stop:942 length:495 start_codon:yes stop_codon:yes gene_type:complete